MPKKDSLGIMLFEYGRTEFLNLLEKEQVLYEHKNFEPGQIVACGEMLDVVATATSIASIATAIVQWVKANSTRMVNVEIVKDNNLSVIRIEGARCSVNEVQKLLGQAIAIQVIQTKEDDAA